MLIGNYLTFEEKSEQSGGSPYCRLCLDQDAHKNVESLEHLISSCNGMNDTRQRIVQNITNLCLEAGLDIKLDTLSNEQLTLFILDPSSLSIEMK